MPLGDELSSESITGKLRVGLVTDVGKIDDGTFNQYAYVGMVRAAQESGMDTTCIETSRPEDSQGNVLMLAEGDCHLIVTVGQGLGLVVERAAKDYPDVRFITVDFAPSPSLPNVMSLLFAEDQAGFLAGALAALMTQSNVLGVVAGDEVPPVIKFRKGFTNGARHVNPKVEVLGEYIETFTDPEKGRSVAMSLIDDGADVIFGAGGQTGSGGIKGAAEQGVWSSGWIRMNGTPLLTTERPAAPTGCCPARSSTWTTPFMPLSAAWRKASSPAGRPSLSVPGTMAWAWLPTTRRRLLFQRRFRMRSIR